VLNDQEVRTHAAQAAATCAASVGISNPSVMLRIASMWETYITVGYEDAQKVIDSWSQTDPAPDAQETPGAQKAGTSSRAQELADGASKITSREGLKVIIDKAKAEGLEEDEVTVEGATGPLRSYLNRCWTLTADQKASRSSAHTDLGL
jgi:hypothetical protein